MSASDMVEKSEQIWLDGALVPWEQGQVHLLTHTLHYGLGVFEGIRCYKLDDGRSAIFRLREHITRLFQSAHIATLEMPWSEEDVVQACLDTVRANRLDECYLRPLAFLGDGAMGLGATQNPTRLAIVVWRWGAYLGEEGMQRGIRAKISSFQRPGVNALMAKGKIVGHYVNSILAKREVTRAGYEEAILLDAEGHVCEASGENLFLVQGGRVATPAFGSSILGGITRDAVITLLREGGTVIEERSISRDELYIADEVFMCGTAAEITPVREVDDRRIGKGERGPLTKTLQELYFSTVRGGGHAEWLTVV